METSTQNQKEEEEEEKKTDLSQDPKNFTFYLRFFFFDNTYKHINALILYYAYSSCLLVLFSSALRITYTYEYTTGMEKMITSYYQDIFDTLKH